MLLFAVHISVQESLGFTPFELVFGHAVRGPLLSLKKKWLDEDPEKISVLKYIATFKDRLFSAGQMAKRNLQSQSKMKVWYDRKIKSRCFEPEERVLFLFPVVGKPLQAKYSGPYKVVKKISDTNYLVRTPGRHKETLVCHINMLKAYHETQHQPELVTLNNKLILENPMHSEDSLDLKAEMEEDTEVEVRLGNDQQPIMLQNSQILNDLSTKLSHLPSAQTEELAEAINQYSEVFTDVPNETNLIEHDVHVGDSAPIKQHPYRVSPMKKELLDKEVQYMLKNDIIEKCRSN